MKTLLVLRHAKSSWNDAAMTDHDRPLNERGRRDAPRVGRWLQDQQLVPDAIISSTAVRARATADAVASTLGLGRRISVDPRLYLADPHAILDVLREAADADAASLLIVGHNPGLEELVEHLTGEPEELPTAALAHIVLPLDSWRDVDATTVGTLVDVWRPKER